MTIEGYYFDGKKSWNVNIIGVRNSESRANRFDDMMIVVYRNGRKNWEVKSYQITTDPGLYWLKKPFYVAGTAILVPDQYRSAYNISKHVKSNAIVLCNNFSTIGIGAGQPSRLDSCKIAVQKAKQFQSSKIKNSVAASDAFFPFEDGIRTLINAGVKTIVQPGGSIRDKKVIEAANKAKIKMLFTGIRHFNH